MKCSVRLLACAVLACGSACTRTPPPRAASVPQDGCLHYSPARTELTGRAFTREVTAPGKATRRALLLKLDTPACVSPLPSSAAEFKRVDAISELELVPRSNLVDAFKLNGYRVRAKGVLAAMQGDGVAAPVGMSLEYLGPEQGGQ